jgi:hypothetical protein
MSKRKMVSAVFTGVAAAGATMAGAPAAFATSGHWVINNNAGNPITNSTPYLAINTAPATLTAGTTTLNCPVSTASASGKFFQDAPVGGQVASVAAANFGPGGSCSLAGIFKFKAALVPANTPLKLIANSSTGGVVTGKIQEKSASTPILAKITATAGLTCSASVSGVSVPATFNNNTHVLTFNPNKVKTLHIKANHGCPGLAAGQSASFQAAYGIHSPSSMSMATITDPS